MYSSVSISEVGDVPNIPGGVIGLTSRVGAKGWRWPEDIVGGWRASVERWKAEVSIVGMGDGGGCNRTSTQKETQRVNQATWKSSTRATLLPLRSYITIIRFVFSLAATRVEDSILISI